MKTLGRQRLDSQIKMRIHKRVHRVLRHLNAIEYTLLHIGELIIIIAIGWGSMLFADYNTSYEMFHRENILEANTYLQIAEKAGKPTGESLISTWSSDSAVNNTFSPGYCTYGVARISPEFFPYSEDKTMQQRTRGGNAIDRCENAEATGFTIGSLPRKGALVVYNPGNGVSSLGHVGKVVFYNNKTKYVIVRDMNRITKNIMSDHWESLETANIKCFIYPKTQNPSTENSQGIQTGGINNQGINTGIIITKPEIVDTETTKIPTIEENNSVETEETTNKPTEPPNIEISTGNHFTANQEPEKETQIVQEYSTVKEIILDTKDISDISKHFIDQHNFIITAKKNDKLKIGDIIELTISVREKTKKIFYEGILPFSINILTNNDKISPNTSRIQMLQGKDFVISIKVIESGKSSIVLIIDDQKIAQIPINID